jgi:CHAT domain-containing protein
VLYAVSAERALHLVAVTPGSASARETPAGRTEPASLVSVFREALEDPSRDPETAAKRLYDAVIAPADADPGERADSALLLSPDGPLRYAPLAALRDGERWLAERRPAAVFTGSTAARLRADAPAASRPASAFGVTLAWRGLAALPGVKDEIAAIVVSECSPGALAGEAFLDAAFDRAALSKALSSETPVVHVASHFTLDPASLELSVLLPGDGKELSLREIMGSADLAFGGLDLPTLPACNTAAGSERRLDGREVESLGEIAQRAGAPAVLATLLPASDASAPELTGEFCRPRHVEGKDKAQALRGAQLLVMREADAPAPASRGPPLSAAAAPGTA